MKQKFHTLEMRTGGPGLYDVTDSAAGFVHSAGIENGLLTCFVRHTSASLLIQENADPDVLKDLEDFMRRIVSRDTKLYRHTKEGPDDMPAHIRSALTQTSLSIPIHNRHWLMGTWQGLYLFEHRDAPHSRQIALHIIGNRGIDMKFARWVYAISGIYGVLILVPGVFLASQVAPPTLNHLEFYYGFYGTALAWQIAFLIIASNPVRWRALMPVTFIEKLGFFLPCLWLHLHGQLPLGGPFYGSLFDGVWLVLFIVAWLKTPKTA